MKRKRHTPEEIVRKLRQVETALAGGKNVETACKEIEVSIPTYHRWKAEYGGAQMDVIKQNKELKIENDRLKRLVAEKELAIAIWKEVGEGAKRSETDCDAGAARRAKAKPSQNGRPRTQKRSRGSCAAFAGSQRTACVPRAGPVAIHAALRGA